MTKRKIQIIVGLMCMALIGLIGFQWFWIREAIAVRNDQFNHKVAESVQEVVHRLEKQEMMYLLQQRIDREQQKSKLERITQLEKSTVKKKPTPKLEKPAQALSKNPQEIEVFLAPNGEELHLRITSDGVPTDVLSPNLKVMMAHQQKIMEEFFRAQEFGLAGVDEFVNRRMEDEKYLKKAFKGVENSSNKLANVNDESVSERPAQIRKVDKSLSSKEPRLLPLQSKSDKAEILREVMQDLLYTKRPTQERVNRFLLDTLLKKQFEENGITLPFEFAVKEAGNNKWLFSTASSRPDDWRQNSYQAALFPNETMQEGSSLFVYFPDQKRYVMSGMGMMFGGSGILILTVMACFYMAVTTILRQKKLSDIKNDFINNMTHEFKTPISTIALATDMAYENRTTNAARLDRYLGIIREENKRLGTHVEKVLQMALLDKGEVRLKRSHVNVHDIITQTLNNQGVQIEQRNGEVEMDYEAENEEVDADEVHLTNILNNLIDNAIKYSPERLKIRVSTRNVNEGIEIKIADSGIGMNREQLSKIFDTFYRIPTGNIHDVKGFGLGLSYVKKMVEAHDGSVQVESKPDEGSTFIVWLPSARTV